MTTKHGDSAAELAETLEWIRELRGTFGPTCEQSLAFGSCYHESCIAVADRYDADRKFNWI